MKNIDTIAFDADDTLWHTETYFQDVQTSFANILVEYAPEEEVHAQFHETEIRNIHLFGYGVKGFTLSMIETAIEISDRKISATHIHDIVMLGKSIFDAPLDLMDGVEETLIELGRHYRLLLITKGDVLDQRNKIEKSGLEHFFERTEVVQEKDPATYAGVFSDYGIDAEKIVMIGNSLKSDILPILDLNGTAVHIPYHVTAHFEKIPTKIDHPRFYEIERIAELPELIRSIQSHQSLKQGEQNDQ
jgi:putative hydrolase of the HAD superfamily